jgi:hypothetical protein
MASLRVDLRAGVFPTRNVGCAMQTRAQTAPEILARPFAPQAQRPNCRGFPQVVASWRWISANRTMTQMTPDGHEAPKLLRPDAEVRFQRHLEQRSSGAPSRPSLVQQTASPRAQPSLSRVGSGVATLTSIEDHTADVLYIKSYRIQTRLADVPAMIVDLGSVGNLFGDALAKEVAIAAARHGQHPTYERRQRPLKVSEVGAGSQSRKFDCKLPVAFKQADGHAVSVGDVAMPTVSNSDLPGLVGLAALREDRAILDFSILELHFCGPGDYDLHRGMPPGADSFQRAIGTFGHPLLQIRRRHIRH